MLQFFEEIEMIQSKITKPRRSAKKSVVTKAVPEVKEKVPQSPKPKLAATVANPQRVPAKKPKGVVLEKAKKERKGKLIRDSFKFPEGEYLAFDDLKARCLKQGCAVKKSELVRAGLLLLSRLSDKGLIAGVEQVEKLKTGRPAR